MRVGATGGAKGEELSHKASLGHGGIGARISPRNRRRKEVSKTARAESGFEAC